MHRFMSENADIAIKRQKVYRYRNFVHMIIGSSSDDLVSKQRTQAK